MGRVIYPRHAVPERKHRHRKRYLASLLVIVGIFVVGNLLLALIYRDRTYPGTNTFHTPIGNLTSGSIEKALQKQPVLPQSLTVTLNSKQQTVTLRELGITQHADRTRDSLRLHRHWLPVLNLLDAPKLSAPVKISSASFSEQADKLAAAVLQEPEDAYLLINDKAVSIQREKTGYSLNKELLSQAILAALDMGNATVSAPYRTIPACVTERQLVPEQQKLQKQLNTTIKFSYDGKVKPIEKKDIAAWYVQQGSEYTISDEAIQQTIVKAGEEFNINVRDIPKVTKAIRSSVLQGKATTVPLTKQVALKTYQYCTAVRGVDAAQLAGLQAKLRSTYTDIRGWTLGGKVDFKAVASGCDYTVWLAAADQMTSFGGVCDADWSCRIGSNVVINYDRWQGASDAWNASGGNLSDYRSMVINHETGHWLAFGHDHCQGSGPAPVMQQQSINLGGCTFNPWPLANELVVLQTKLGI